MILRLIDTVDINSLRSRVEKLERLGQSDIVDTINGIIDKRLENFTPSVSSYDQSSVNEDSNSRNQVLGEIDTGKTLAKDNKKDKNQGKADIPTSEDISSSITLDPKTVHEIREMIVYTSGTMLNSLFKDEGFNYQYTGEDFTLFIEDEFYRIFIETKIDEISEKLSTILKKEVNFTLLTGKEDKEKKQGTKKDSSDTIDKLKNIFDNELIIK